MFQYNAQPGEVIKASLINSYSQMSVPEFWRAVNFVTDNLTSFPRAVYLDNAKIDHPVNRLLERRPNGYQTATTCFKTFFLALRSRRRAYMEVERDAAYRPIALHNLMVDDICPARIDRQQFYIHLPTKRLYAAADIIHVFDSSEDGLDAQDYATLFPGVFQQAKSLTKFETKYIQQGTVIRGSIQIPAGLSKEKLAEMEATLRRYIGPNSDRDVIVLTEGATLNNATITPAESQMDKQHQRVTTQIACMTGVDPYWLFDRANTKYNNGGELAGQDAVKFLFRPLLDMIEDELTTKLLTEAEQESGHKIKLNPDALMRGNTIDQSKNVIAEVNGGVRKPNEGRELLGLEPDTNPDSDKLREPHNVASAPSANKVENSDTPANAVTFAMFAPIIDAATKVVETKAEKALANASSKTEQERTIWANVFSGQQATFAADAFAPVAEVMATAGIVLDVQAIADSYADEIKRRAAGHEPKPLAQIVGELTNG